ncbi:MAG: four helix bundle protein [Myxococcaceae bacterium]
MQNFTELRVWKQAYELTIAIHEVLERAPRTHGFAVMDQLRRAIVSVGANIAEGTRRETRREYARFLNIAQGSVAESDHLVRVAAGIGLLPKQKAAEFLHALDRLGRGLSNLRDRVIRTNTENPAPHV